MNLNEDLKLINELTLHIEKLEMDNEIDILRDDLDEVRFEKGREHILLLKETLGKLLQNIDLTAEEITELDKIISDKDLIKKLQK